MAVFLYMEEVSKVSAHLASRIERRSMFLILRNHVAYVLLTRRKTVSQRLGKMRVATSFLAGGDSRHPDKELNGRIQKDQNILVFLYSVGVSLMVSIRKYKIRIKVGPWRRASVARHDYGRIEV